MSETITTTETTTAPAIVNPRRAKTVVQTIASALQALRNCQKSGNDYGANWETLLSSIERNCLPSGSGIDRGTKIDFDRSNGGRIVLNFSFHHMNDGGYYDGWTDHSAIITPAFEGFDIRITGRNQNDVKEYLSDLFHNALSEDCEYTSEFRARIVPRVW